MCRGGEKKAYKVHHGPADNSLYALAVNLERTRIPRLSLVARLQYDVINVTHSNRDERSGRVAKAKMPSCKVN
jgi:hypothetical protein